MTGIGRCRKQGRYRTHSIGRPRGRGWTLFELVISIVILGILGGITAVVMLEGGSAFARQNSQADNLENARVAMQEITRDLLHINSATAADIPAFGASSIHLKTYDAVLNDITWTLAGNTLTRTTLGNPARVVADYVTGFNLQYLTNIEGVAGAASAIWVIQVQIDVQATGQTVTLRTRIHPRRFSNPTWKEE